MKLGPRLRLAFTGVSLISALAGGVGLYYVHQIDETMHEVTDVAGPAVQRGAYLATNVRDALVLTRDLYVERDPLQAREFERELDELAQHFSSDHERLVQLVGDRESMAGVRIATEHHAVFVDLGRRMTSARVTELEKEQTAVDSLVDFEITAEIMREMLGELVAREDVELEWARTRVEDSLSMATPAEQEGRGGELVSARIAAAQSALQLQQRIMEGRDCLRRCTDEADPSRLDEIEGEFRQIVMRANEDLESLLGLATGQVEQDAIADLTELLDGWDEIVLRADTGFFAARGAMLHAKRTAAELAVELQASADRVARAIDEAAADARDLSEHANRRGEAVVARARTLVVLCIVAGLLGAFGLATLIVRRIARPIARTAEVLSDIAIGRLDSPLEYEGRDDEIGVLASSCNRMVESLRDAVRVTETVAAGDLSRRVEVKSDEDDLALSVNQMIESLQGVADQANAIADGDLSQEAQIRGGHDELGTALQRMVESFRTVVEQAHAVAAGDLSVEVEPRSDEDQLRHALAGMVRRLREAEEERERVQWIKAGRALLTERMIAKQSLERLAAGILASVWDYVEADIALLYGAVGPNHLRLIGQHGRKRHRDPVDEIIVGEGILGRIAETGIRAGDRGLAPSSFGRVLQISDGTAPHMASLPIIGEEGLEGMLVLGAERPFSGSSLEFLERVERDLAAALDSARHRQEVTASEGRWRSLWDSSPDLLSELSLDGATLAVNRLEDRGYGEEVIGTSYYDLHAPEVAERLQAAVAKVIECGEVEKFETTTTDHLGPHATSWVITPVVGTGGRVERILVSEEDVTEQRRAEAALGQTQRLESLGELAAGIAHEINTPTQYVSDNTRFLEDAIGELAQVLARCDRLRTESSEGIVDAAVVTDIVAALEELEFEDLREEMTAALRDSFEGLRQITTIVGAMKEFSHPGGQAMEDTDLNRCLENAMKVSRNLWKNAVEMETDLDESIPPVPCLRAEVGQVFLNLITNATHAIEDVRSGEDPDARGSIRIRSRVVDGSVEVTIADTGCGMNEEVRARVFEPFFTTKDVGRGTGQGLNLAYTTIVDRHGGAISCESTPGEGTTFTVRLPLVASADRAGAAA